jgi:integrase
MPEKIATTHVLMNNELVLYRRERSAIWQCRFKVADIWQRASTKQRDLKLAKKAARELMIEAEIRKRSNLPVVTRRFRSVAQLAIQRMDTETANKQGKVSYNDYKRLIEDYLIPILGNRNITNIDSSALDDYEARRIQLMEKTPSKSTILKHNAALNRVFDEAVIRGFLTEANRPKLVAKGKQSDRRPAFELEELRAVLNNLAGWVERARTKKSKTMRAVLCDYVEMLIDTGARPGKELLDLKWRHIKFSKKPVVVTTEQVDEYGELIQSANLNRSVEMTVTGKTGTRTIVGMKRTVQVLERIAKRNYEIEGSIVNPFAKLTLASNDDKVFKVGDGRELNSFQKMFESYLEEHSLLIDKRTEQKRVFYSLRHTYATLALTYDSVPIHTLAKQMGTSVLMIERHYSHLKVVQAIEQLRGEETNRLIAAGSVVDAEYASKRATKVAKQSKSANKKVSNKKSVGSKITT